MPAWLRAFAKAWLFKHSSRIVPLKRSSSQSRLILHRRRLNLEELAGAAFGELAYDQELNHRAHLGSTDCRASCSLLSIIQPPSGPCRSRYSPVTLDGSFTRAQLALPL